MSVTPGVKRQEGGIAETARVIVHALIIALVIRTLLFQPFNIPSGSMQNTLLIGDYLFVSKFSYGYTHYSLPFSPPLFSGRIWSAEPQRGDVVVFRFPKDDSIDYIKRVIGLPGDRIQVRDEQLYINDDPVKRERIEDGETDEFGRTIPVKRWRETLPNGVTYVTLETPGRPNLANTKIFEVPPGHYFMMGDNRDNSSDSRADVGFVPFENLIGRAQVIFFSIQGEHAWAIWTWPWSVRWGRLLTLVR
jgi:signal peptidase I